MKKNKRKLNKGAHSVYEVYLHIVFSTKYRKPVITQKMLARMSQIFAHICSKKKSELIRFNGECDHVHLLVSIAPSTQISDLVCCLKSGSSRILRQEFPKRIGQFYRKPVLWTPSYCVVSAGGASLDVLKKYIDEQKSPEDPEE